MNKERLLLAGSLALNLILLFLWLGGVAERERREESAETSSEIAAVTRGAAGVDESMSEATMSTATFEPTATDSLPAAQVATATATPDAPPDAPPTEEPTVATTPTVASTPEPTNTPVPPTATPVPQPEWLNYLNGFREEANLPPLLENGAWSAGSLLHSIYMVKTDEIGHSERVASGWYSEEGYQAAVNGNIAATVWNGATAQWAIDYWMTAPFHALPILDPQLETVGFGFHLEESEGIMAAGTMQLLDGFVPEPADESIYPVLFPRDGGQTWLRSSSLFEWPRPLAACPGYEYPVGAPIIAQVGSGRAIPRFEGSRLQLEGQDVAHCVLTESNYTNPVPVEERSGRNALAVRDAIVLIPFQRLALGAYTATIFVNGEEIRWAFEVVERPE